MNLVKVGLLTAGALLVTGCASNSELAQVKTEALQAADDAKRTAEQALSEAREARTIASEANARSMRSEEMLNRGFKRSMYK